jgi:hypothetical protein
MALDGPKDSTGPVGRSKTQFQDMAGRHCVPEAPRNIGVHSYASAKENAAHQIDSHNADHGVLGSHRDRALDVFAT